MTPQNHPLDSRKTLYFEYDVAALAFNGAVTRAFSEIQKRIVAQYLPPENTQRFRHDGAWSTRGSDKAPGGQLQKHSAVLET